MYGLSWLKNWLIIIPLLILIGQWNRDLLAQQYRQSEAAFPNSSDIYYTDDFQDDQPYSDSYGVDSGADQFYTEEAYDGYPQENIVYLPYSEYFSDSFENSNIRFRADFPLSGLNALLDEVNLLEHDMMRYLSLSQERELVEIFIFEQKPNYLRFVMKEFPGAPLDRRALFIKKPGHPGIVVLQLTREIDDDIRHEMTHAFLHSRFNNIPLWLDEGLAEYFELHRDRRAYQKPYMKKAIGKFLFSKTAPSLKKIEKINDVYSFGLKEYQDSWAWVHFMIHYSKDSHQLLAAYLSQLGTGQISGPIEPYLANTVPGYKKEYIQHFEKWIKIQEDSLAQMKTLQKLQKAETKTEIKVDNTPKSVPTGPSPKNQNVASEKKPKTIVFR